MELPDSPQVFLRQLRLRLLHRDLRRLSRFEGLQLGRLSRLPRLAAFFSWGGTPDGRGLLGFLLKLLFTSNLSMTLHGFGNSTDSKTSS
ncbi:hypothetical protein DTL42_18580 [Bremerella cremea]|uniref:Uncharacterized protein n=1 Tax=Bremerella cremea TaxID=1031537 RepID=A0A368KMW3_9BACT|nr:hypothetical protein [Bremerella cremea]RCS43990.1 hypothetical protein DTL42_18580 [Bremerella cremea]